MYESLLIVVAIATGIMCAEIPAQTAPAPVYKPEAERPQADAPVYKQEVPESREPLIVDLLGEGKHVQERKKHQAGAGTAAEAGGGGGAGYTAVAQQEVTYPNVAYAPGYGYEPAYGSQPQAFDRYGNAVGYYESDVESYEPPTALGLLWSAMPDARGLVGVVGRGLSLVLSGAFLVALGAALTVAVCSFTGLCAVSFRGVALTEQMRALVSDERLGQLGAAAGVLQRALAKYRAMQREGGKRR